MSRRLSEFGSAVVVLVTFSEAESLAAYRRRRGLIFPIVRDPDRETYRSYGLQRASLARVWSWRALRRYVEIYRSEGLTGLHRPVEDTRQLGGDFVISRDGTLTYGFWSQGPDDRPTVDDLINAAKDAQ